MRQLHIHVTGSYHTGAHKLRTSFAPIEQMSNAPYLPTYQNDVAAFIGELRDLLFTSQKEAAAYFHLDRSRISRYESGNSTPNIGYLACLVQLLAERADNEPEAQQLLLQEVNKAVVRPPYRKSRFRDWAALSGTAEAYLTQQRAKSVTKPQTTPVLETPTRDAWQVKLDQRLDIPPSISLIGVAVHLERLSTEMASLDTPWVVCIEGLGGIGKTSLANALIRQPEMPDRFHDIAWVSAKQQHFSPDTGLEQVTGPALQADTFTDVLLTQLDSTIPLSQTSTQKLAVLTELLKKSPYLIVIDNLETMDDHQALLPMLQKLSNPSKFLLTTRHSLRTHSTVFSFCLEELNRTDTLQFIRHEGQIRGLTEVVNAPENQLKSIYTVVGGNPLALKLVVGQISVLSLPEVLDSLKQAKGRKDAELYSFIYWQAWNTLDEAGQQVLLMMPLAQDGTVDQLMALTELERDDLNQALQKLAELSLVQIGGTLQQRRYTIHRLTETFILNEAIEWKIPG